MGTLIKKNPITILYLIILGTLVFRGALIFSIPGYLGVDGGAYLIGVNSVLGDEPTNQGFPRPPLAPGWLLVPFIEFFGIDYGYKIWTLIFSVTPLPVVYLLSRKILSPGNSLLTTIFIALDPFHAEMIATGVLPMISMSLYVVMIWGIIDLVENRLKTRNLIALIFPLALIPFINQTTAGITLVILPIIFGYVILNGYFDFWNKFDFKKYSALFLCLLVGGIISLFALPWYLKVLPVTGLMSYPGAFIYLATDGVAWGTFILCVPLGIFLLKKTDNLAIKIVGIHILIMGILSIFMSYDETVINIFYRSRYFHRFFWIIGFTWFVVQLAPGDLFGITEGKNLIKKTIPGFAFVMAILILPLMFSWNFLNQAKISENISPDSLQALKVINETNHSNIISNSFTMSLWIAGLEKVKSPHVWTTKPPPTFIENDEHTRCILNWVKDCNYSDSIQSLGVSHVLIETRFPYYNEMAVGNYLAPDNQWEITDNAPWLNLIYKKGSVRLYKVQ